MAEYHAKAGRVSGKIMAVRQRQAALERYYLSPVYCQNCNEVLNPKKSQKIGDLRKRRFCGHSCAAQYSNSRRSRKKTSRASLECEICKKLVLVRKGNDDPSAKGFMCRSCLALSNIGDFTKEEIFSSRKNWQSARSDIRQHAYKTFVRSCRPFVCCVCGYDKHVEVAHIVAVSQFPPSSSISEINSINNLTALCPNHHWEFDNGHLSRGDLLLCQEKQISITQNLR